MDDYPTLGQRFLEWIIPGFYVLIGVLLLAGTLFLALALWDNLVPTDMRFNPTARTLEQLVRLFSASGSVALATGLYLGAIALILIVGVMTICRRLDLQTYYLRSLSERRRASTPERMQP